MKQTVIAVDCMSGDHGASAALPACEVILKRYPDVALLLVGQRQHLQVLQHERVEIVDAPEIVTMEDKLKVALRQKKQSSMRLAIEQVKQERAQVAISAGNTGALMALSRYLLKTMPHIDRPAIAFSLPNIKSGFTTMLDLGANVDCSSQHLVQFALLGSALDSVQKNIPYPSVGLLNIGEEDIKGNEVVKEAAKLLQQAKQANIINFYGNIEGDDIFKATTDVVVCDGFVGNVALKTIEGLSWMMSTSLKQEFSHNWLTKLSAILTMPVLNSFKRRFDSRNYNGAALLGLRGLVFKSHGSADAYAFEKALERAYFAANRNLLAQISQRIEKIHVVMNQPS